MYAYGALAEVFSLTASCQAGTIYSVQNIELTIE